MKKLFIILSVIAILSFKNITQEKAYTITLTEGQINMLWNSLQFSRLAIQSSDVSAKEVNNATRGIDSISKVLAVQYQLQAGTNTNTNH
jgi:TolB-like protein